MHPKPSGTSGPTLYMLAMAYVPLLYLGAGGLTVWLVHSSAAGSVALALIWIYLLPPLLCRLTLWWFGSPQTAAATPDDRAYKLWWFLTQLQMIFNRIGLLEDLLRLLPGVYPVWLNLWGSKVSLLVFWAREVLVADRYLVRIGPGVTFGSYSVISGHLVLHTEDNSLRLVVAPVVIEAGAIIGAGTAIGPGCRVADGEMLPAGRRLPPFSVWQSGRKHTVERTAAGAEHASNKACARSQAPAPPHQQGK